MDIPGCMTAEGIRSVMTDDEPLSMLSDYVLCQWPSVGGEVQKELQWYWSFRNELC